MTLRFRYSCFYVSDVPTTISFYEKAFGFSLRYMHPSNGYAELQTGDTLLPFVGDDFLETATLIGDLRYAPNRADGVAAGAQVAFATDDLDGDRRRAIEAGATIVKKPETKPWGQTTGYLRDLNGVIVELCTKSPRDG